MAVDTRNKRASCIGIAGPYRFQPPRPDGSLSPFADRRQLVFCYSGFTSIPTLSAGTCPYIPGRVEESQSFSPRLGEEQAFPGRAPEADSFPTRMQECR